MQIFAAIMQQVSGTGSNVHGPFSAQPLQYSSSPYMYYQAGPSGDYYCNPTQDNDNPSPTH